MMWRDPVIQQGCGGCIVFIAVLLAVTTLVTYLTPQ